MHDCEEFSDRLRHKSLEGVAITERDPLGEMETLGVLYFPELRSQVGAYGIAHRKHITASATVAYELSTAGTDLVLRQAHFDKFKSEFNDRTEALMLARKALDAAARLLLMQIAGIE